MTIMGMKAPTPPPYKPGDVVVLPAPPPPPPKAFAASRPIPSQEQTTAHCHCHDLILPGDMVTYVVRFKKI
ncbi:hypothetical protein CS371_17610 (plasmid) [Serratia marcescens]|nr:hypothetical protein CS371_17610 [Serratia marcescens]PYA46972.1 hypothetical protein DMW45_17200 [Serratia marcescens]